MKVPTAIVPVAVLLAACAAEDGLPDPSGPTPEWTTELDLRVGSLDDPEYALTAIRGLEVGPDGSIYTLHPTEAMVRHFDADGTLVRTIGGRGGGPGEFQRASVMGIVADTLWVLDGQGYRVSQFALDGSFINSFSVPFDMGSAPREIPPPRARGLLADGTVWGEPPAFSRLLADGTLTERAPVLMTREGVATDTLPSIPFGNMVWDISVTATGGGSYRAQPFSDMPIYVFSLTERAMIRADRDAPESSEDATYRITKLSFAGDTLFSRTFAFDPIPIAETEADSLSEAFAASAAESPFFGISVGEARRLAESTLYRPAHRTGLRYLVPGMDGTIWLGEEPGDADAATWRVLDSDGTEMGRLTLPANVLVRQADYPFIWGVETDELDVPYVVRYRVTSPMIAMGDAGSGATLARTHVVAGPTSQDSRQSRHRPSPASTDIS